jgi:hypothetical protein
MFRKHLIWNVTETHIQDTISKKVFTFSSPTDEILESSLADLIKTWKILPH